MGKDRDRGIRGGEASRAAGGAEPVDIVPIDRLSAAAIPVEPTPGIYFLFRGEALVYIGRARVHYTRLAAHLKNKRGLFNRMAFIAVPIDSLDAVEGAYIRHYRPELNIAIPGEKRAQIPLGMVPRAFLRRWIGRLQIGRPATVMRAWAQSGGPKRHESGSYPETVTTEWLSSTVAAARELSLQEATEIVQQMRPRK